jgi:hypothetical protein
MRGRRRLGATCWLAGSFLWAFGGCGDGTEAVSTSHSEARVVGRVTIKGKPASKGRVIFSAANSLRKDVGPRSGEIRKGGRYEVTTFIGGNSVAVDGTGDPAAGVYNSRHFEVQSGTNTLDLDLPLNASSR